MYLQGSLGKYIYLIFSGSCLLQKCINKKLNDKKASDYELSSKKPKFYDILHLSKGGLAGLESIYYSDQIYQYSMKVLKFNILQYNS